MTGEHGEEPSSEGRGSTRGQVEHPGRSREPRDRECERWLAVVMETVPARDLIRESWDELGRSSGHGQRTVTAGPLVTAADMQ